MNVIYGSSDERVLINPAGVGLGNFDGLHVGHMELVNTLISESKASFLNSVVYTFTKHPENIIRKSLFTPLITTFDKKVELLGRTNLDYLYFEEFDENFSRMKPEEFVKSILVERLNIKLAVAGEDYRFGYMGQGNTDLLYKLGQRYGFRVLIIPPVKIDDNVVSSTLIRKFILKGYMDKVERFLGRLYSIKGEVVHGKKLGRKLGFPTANLNPEGYLVLPNEGVYITKTLSEGKIYKSVTSIGKNPTVDNSGRIYVETYILDFNKDIYGKDIEVFFVSKLRGEEKFNSLEELVSQIQKDVLQTKAYFKSN